MKTRGFTLIELLAVIVILAVIALIATPIILGIISDSKKQAFKDSAYGIIDAAKYNYVETMYKGETPVNITFTYENSEESSSVEGNVLNYEGTKPQNGQVDLNNEGKVSLILYDGKWCATKGFNDTEVIVEEKSLDDCMPTLVDESGANAPVLAQGMTPIIWDVDTTQWIEASNADNPYKQNWYDYTNKKWANAKTEDGSMWVWIPRYAYQITSGYHTSTAGTIDVKFLQGTTNTTKDSTVIESIPTYSDSDTQSNFINHPGFTFGTTELTGIWVAKFEPTAAEGIASSPSSCSGADNVTTKTVKVLPNVSLWSCILIGNAFTTIRNMETKAVYGWNTASTLKADGTFTTDTNNLDTHLMKNIEWGAVAYLSKSQYGKNTEEIYINNNQNYITGCSGDTAIASEYNGCQNTYESTGGVKASTTGNIYGIYDISGGAEEFVSAYINNAFASTYGSSIVNANNKYKDVYTVTTDNQATNYSNATNKKGDAVWETSNGYTFWASWFNDYSKMLATNGAWFVRGGYYTTGYAAGAFSFEASNGYTYSYYGFRPVLAVADGL